jgi:hypothetical protein
MLRKSASKIISSSINFALRSCSGRGSQHWILADDSKESKALEPVKMSQSLDISKKIEPVEDYGMNEGIKFPCAEKKPVPVESTPCAEKKHSPCADAKTPKIKKNSKKNAQSTESNRQNASESNCAHHKDMVPPGDVLEQLKSFELKSNCASFHLKTCGHDRD